MRFRSSNECESLKGQSVKKRTKRKGRDSAKFTTTSSSITSTGAALRRLIDKIVALKPVISIPMTDAIELNDCIADGLAALTKERK